MAQPQPAPIYLFISKDCNNCRTLIQEIRKKPEIAKNIQAVPIEEAPRLPPGLTHVPTIIEKGVMLVGEECFKWIAKQGELEAAPLMSSRGGTFENNNYSFIGSEDSGSTLDGGGMGGNYSIIGEQNGSVGMGEQAPPQAKTQSNRQQLQIPQQQQFQQQQQQQQTPQQLMAKPAQMGNGKKATTVDFEKLQEMRNQEMSEQMKQRPQSI
jgi:hypothetical protein